MRPMSCATSTAPDDPGSHSTPPATRTFASVVTDTRRSLALPGTRDSDRVRIAHQAALAVLFVGELVVLLEHAVVHDVHFDRQGRGRRHEHLLHACAVSGQVPLQPPHRAGARAELPAEFARRVGRVVGRRHQAVAVAARPARAGRGRPAPAARPARAGRRCRGCARRAPADRTPRSCRHSGSASGPEPGPAVLGEHRHAAAAAGKPLDSISGARQLPRHRALPVDDGAFHRDVGAEFRATGRRRMPCARARRRPSPPSPHQRHGLPSRALRSMSRLAS